MSSLFGNVTDLFKNDTALRIALAITWLITIVLYPLIPAELPIHWDMRYAPDRWMSKSLVVWVFPVLALASYYVLFSFNKKTLPAKSLYRNRDTLSLLRIIFPTFFVLTQSLALAAWVDTPMHARHALIMAAGVLFITLRYAFTAPPTRD